VESDLVLGAMKGMVAAVGDPYTVFLTPSENKVTQEDLSGNFEGVGIQIGFKGASLAVVAPLPGSPAEEAGVKAGDLIAGIKDEEKDIERGTVGITLPEAVQIIRGKAGTTVKLSLLRDGNDTPIVVDLVRREINVPSVTLSFVGPQENIAHLKVSKFGGETLTEWDNAILEIQKKQNLAGIVVDVRNNPGGYLQGAVDLGSEFLEEGEVVVSEEYADGSRDEYYVERVGRLIRENTVVLINGGSASASEILAGALRDTKKAPLIGETSFGKGTVQEAKQLENDLGLHITVARWLTPAGTWVNEKGLTPDHIVEDNVETPEDEQLSLQKPLKYLQISACPQECRSILGQ
jgi:carboxyl-terminal processing protease